jgi:riboflavin synthase
MFTGLIESVCMVRAVTRAGKGCNLTIDLDSLVQDAEIGDSFAVNGVCLTVTRLQGSTADFDISSETMLKSTMSLLKSGMKVNIERALRLGDRMGGHMVQGHVDGVARVGKVDKQGGFRCLTFTGEPVLMDQIVQKGSVAVDGISLTVSSLAKGQFCAAVIPETVQRTNIAQMHAGDQVNIEIDIVSKTITRYLDNILMQSDNLTVDKLRQLGF